MKRMHIRIFVLITVILLITGCGNGFTTNGIYDGSSILVYEAKQDINIITYDELKQKLEAKEAKLLIDVREPGEFEEGYINMADEESGEYPYPDTFTVNIPRGLLEFKMGSKDYWDNDLFVEMPEKDDYIVIYCFSGGRAALATKTLQDLGYTNVVSYNSGYRKWEDPTLPDIVGEAPADGG